MDPLSTTVVGSRHPITFSLVERSTSPVHPSETNGDTVLALSKIPSSVVRPRRKPSHTYKSPAAHELLSLRVEGHVGTSQAAPQPISDRTLSESTGSTSNAADHYRLSPPLPLYHPLGSLALSVPALDPTLYGHPNAVNVEEYAQTDADAIRRSSSRARRPAAKLRDRDMADDEMSAVLDGHSAVNGQVASTGATSPRKRRTGGASGTRRRRRENGADGTYPNPPKRTRNTRGTSAVTAFASPLAGPSITTAEDDVLDSGEHVELDTTLTAPDTQGNLTPAQAAGELEVQEQRRSTRSRRTRPSAPMRRHSSASETTTTSVSVSIAANPRNTRPPGGRAYQEPAQQEEGQPDVEMKQEETAEGRSEQVDHMEEVQNAPGADSNPVKPSSTASEVVDGVDKRSTGNISETKASEASQAEPLSQVGLLESQNQKTRVSEKIVDAEKNDEGSAAERDSKTQQVAVVVENLKLKEPSIPDKSRIGQKIAPTSWTRFATPVAGPTGPSVNQKKVREEEKEEGELTEESDSTPPP